MNCQLLKAAYFILAIALSLATSLAQQAMPEIPKPKFEFLPPQSVSVFPVFFVASDQRDPTFQHADTLVRHLKLAQRWFRGQLKGDSTFELFSEKPYLFRGRHPLAHYVGLPRGERAPAHVEELLEHFGLTRFNCPFVFLMIVDELKERPAGGRPMNSGFNGGGGLVQMSRLKLLNQEGFQGVLRHELGHSFGLQHVTAYGYDMKASKSVMSYNPLNKTVGFRDSRSPAILIPEDIRVLAANDRVFRNLDFDRSKHVPKSYEISPKMFAFRPVKFPNRPNDEVRVVSLSGESVGTHAKNLVRKTIRPNVPSESSPRGINFDSRSMWQSDDTNEEWRSLEVTFPLTVGLTGIRVFSQHSGRVHPVEEFKVSVFNEDQSDTAVVLTEAMVTDEQLYKFDQTNGRKWRLHFKPGTSGKVVLRGLKFYHDNMELFAASPAEEYVSQEEDESVE